MLLDLTHTFHRNGKDHYTVLRKANSALWMHIDDDKAPAEVPSTDLSMEDYEISLIFLKKVE